MSALEHSTVYRAGSTAHRLNLETKDIRFEADTKTESDRIRFSIASAGGGDTAVLVRIGVGDLPAILGAVARAMPQHGGMFIDSAKAAIDSHERCIETMKKDLETRDSELEQLCDRMEKAQEALSSLWYDVSDDETSDRIDKIKDSLDASNVRYPLLRRMYLPPS